MTTIKFGTDGWRALMETDFTMDNVSRVAQAYADHMNASYRKAKGRAPRVVVGYDFRKNSEEFAARVASILLGNGIEVLLSTKPCPTPAVSFTIVREGFDGGVAITASHNPAGYNGFKIKSDFGGSAEKSITDAVESLIDKTPVKSSPEAPKKRDLNERFLENLKNYLKLDKIKGASFRVLVDSMHGVGARNIEHILAGGQMKVTTIRGERDVTFGGYAPEPIPKNLVPSIELMKSGSHDLCIVTDGDADRVGALRPGGEFVSPGTILSLIMLHMAEDLGRKGSVVTTLSNTALIYKVARKLGLTVHETPIGFKYICDIMRKENVLIGGEESGGIAFQDYLFERDGMLSGLLLMEMMAMRGQTFEEILRNVEKEFGKLYYVRNDINYPNELKPKLFDRLKTRPPQEFAGHKVKKVNSADGMKFTFDDDSWLLFRLSGTEPILRIYSEATSQELAETLVRHGKDLAFGL
jgi:phosphomannomutase